jgi:hypothetical protein
MINKIAVFVEGKSDVRFFAKLLYNALPKKDEFQNDEVKISSLNGKDNFDVRNIKITLQEKLNRTLIILDADDNYQSTKQKCDDIKTELEQSKIKLEYHIVAPNQERGILEDYAIELLQQDINIFGEIKCRRELESLLTCVLKDNDKYSQKRKAFLTAYTRFLRIDSNSKGNDFFNDDDLIDLVIQRNKECERLKHSLLEKIKILSQE